MPNTFEYNDNNNYIPPPENTMPLVKFEDPANNCYQCTDYINYPPGMNQFLQQPYAQNAPPQGDVAYTPPLPVMSSIDIWDRCVIPLKTHSNDNPFMYNFQVYFGEKTSGATKNAPHTLTHTNSTNFTPICQHECQLSLNVALHPLEVV